MLLPQNVGVESDVLEINGAIVLPSTASTAAAISVRWNDYDLAPERRAVGGRRISVVLEPR